MWSKQTKFMVAVGVIVFFIFSLWLIIYSPDSVQTYSPSLKAEDIKNRPDKGPADAKAVVRVYLDFYCALCKEMDIKLEKIEEKFGDKIRLEYRYFPLSDISTLPAMAAECASQQEKFWTYRDLLFGDQQELLNNVKLKTFAGRAGLDQKKFDDCLNGQKTKFIVESDIKEALAQGVDSTPRLFLNGRRADASSLEMQIDQILAVSK